MKVKVTLRRPGGRVDDLLVTFDATVTVAALAEAIERTDPTRSSAGPPPAALTLALDGSTASAPLRSELPAIEAGLHSGSIITLTPGSAAYGDAGAPPVATLAVVSGPNAGSSYPLRAGTNYVGRDRSCEVRLTDPALSRYHARVNVADVIEVIDNNSSNGVVVGADRVPRVVVRPGQQVLLGDSLIVITAAVNLAARSGGGASDLALPLLAGRAGWCRHQPAGHLNRPRGPGASPGAPRPGAAPR